MKKIILIPKTKITLTTPMKELPHYSGIQNHFKTLMMKKKFVLKETKRDQF